MKYLEQNKFTQTIVSFRYLLPLNKETITTYNLMCYMLQSKTEKYQNKEEISHVFNKNYGTKMSVGLSVYGKTLSMQYQFRFVRPDWIEQDGYVTSLIEIMDQFIDHPVFCEETLMESKYLLRNRLLAQLDDPASLSILKAFQNISSTHSISISSSGYLDLIDEISLDQVKKLYNSLPAPIIYMTGISNDKLNQFLVSHRQLNSFDLNYQILDSTLQYQNEVIEKDIEQSYIAKVYATQIDTKQDEYYSLLVLNSILGQSPVNLLFNNIREKHSYCYSIASSLIRFDGAIYIYAGCAKEDVEAVNNLIEQQIQKLIDQDYEDFYLESAKKDLVDSLMASQDVEYSHIERQFIADALKQGITQSEKNERIMKVTKEDVSECAKKLLLISDCVVKEK